VGIAISILKLLHLFLRAVKEKPQEKGGKLFLGFGEPGLISPGLCK